MVPASDPPSSARAGAPWWLLAVAAATCLGYLLLERRVLGGGSGFPLDDSWIHLALARNLAAGQGLSLNAGELISGSTAPLWTGLLSLLLVLPGPAALWVKLGGVALHLAGVDATYRLARALELSPGSSTLAAGLSLGTGWLIWSALSGLEIPLFVVLSLWGVLLHLDERRAPGGLPLAMPVLAAATLARPEGILLLALAVLDRLLKRDTGAWRALLPGVGLALLLLLPVAAFNLAVGGSPLPTTFAAKAGGRSDWLPGLQELFGIFKILFSVQPWSVLLAASGGVELARRLGTPRDRGLLPVLWLLALPLAYATMSPPGALVAGNFGRYYFPLYPFLAVIGVLGLAPLAIRVTPAAVGARRRLAVGLVVVALLWPTALSTLRGSARYAQSVVNVHDSDVAMARWLTGRLPPEAVLAVNDIGALGYLLPNRLIDLAGIANPELAAYLTAPDGRAAGIGRFLAERRPDYLVVFPAWFPELVGAGGQFRPVHGLRIADNITMGGEELVLYATPWTRYPLAKGP
ncbi:MAG: hypothetical protein ACE5EG_10810 [Thermoanaerobaculia bacterium]